MAETPEEREAKAKAQGNASEPSRERMSDDKASPAPAAEVREMETKLPVETKPADEETDDGGWLCI